MKRHLCFLALIAGLLGSPALAAPDVWYAGGSYDGYDRNSALGAIGSPQVNNAGGATNVTPQSAWLNGTLVCTGSAETVVYVYWGTTDGGTNKGNWGTWTNFGVCVQGQELTANVSVNPDTTYSYRFYATNTALEEGWASPSASFTTPAAPDLNNGAGAAPVSYTTAVLNGALINCPSAIVSVYWGQDTNAWANTNSLGTRSRGPFWTFVAGMSPGSGYYYRCYATNAYGEKWSAVAAFTTRVESMVFVGGSYDGYDQYSAVNPMMPVRLGTVILIR